MPRLTRETAANKLVRSKTAKAETVRADGPAGSVTLQGKWRSGNAFVSITKGGGLNGRLGTPGLTVPGTETVETWIQGFLGALDPVVRASAKSIEITNMPALFQAMGDEKEPTRVAYVTFRAKGEMKNGVRTLEEVYEAIPVKDPWTRISLCAPGVAACTSTPRDYTGRVRAPNTKLTLPGFDTMTARPKRAGDPSFTLSKKGTITIHNAKSTRDAADKRRWIAARLPPLAAFASV